MMPKELNSRYRLQYGRDAEPADLQRGLMLAPPEERIAAIENLQRQLENPDLSIRERADLLSLKAQMTNTHLRMSRVSR